MWQANHRCTPCCWLAAQLLNASASCSHDSLETWFLKIFSFWFMHFVMFMGYITRPSLGMTKLFYPYTATMMFWVIVTITYKISTWWICKPWFGNGQYVPWVESVKKLKNYTLCVCLWLHVGTLPQYMCKGLRIVWRSHFFPPYGNSNDKEFTMHEYKNLNLIPNPT